MAFLSFGYIDKNIIPVIAGCFFCFLARLVFNIKDAKLYKYKIITNILSALSKILAFFPFIIYKYRSKKVNNFEV